MGLQISEIGIHKVEHKSLYSSRKRHFKSEWGHFVGSKANTNRNGRSVAVGK